MTSYFNTYYNAQRLFAEAEDEVWSLPELQKTGRNYYLAQFNISQSTKGKFTQVVEKCSKLLQYHPNSSLVDDALLMIGMSYFYEGDNLQAERKFRELINGYPGTGLALRARLMLAFTNYKANNPEAATASANEALEAATTEGEKGLVGHASLLLGQLAIESKDTARAIEEFRTAGKFCESAELRAASFQRAAEIHAGSGDYENAEEAYLQVVDISKTYQDEYRGRLGAARMRARQGDYKGALSQLRQLRSNINNRDYFGEIEYEIGNVYRDQGDLPAALMQYAFVDTAYARSENAANADYQIGLIYETKLGRFDSARTAYNRGRQAAASASLTPLLVFRSDYMNRYRIIRSEIARFDSIRTAVIARLDSSGARSDTSSRVALSAPRDSSGARTDTSGRFTLAPRDTVRSQIPNAPEWSLDSVNARLAQNESELATLFYTSMGRTDSAKFWYRRLISEHPNNPAVPRALFVLAQIAGQDSTVPRGTADTLLKEIIHRFPQSPFAAEAQRILGLPIAKQAEDEAEKAYLYAVDLFKVGRMEEAVDALKKVPAKNPDSPFASRAHYAIGWMYENVQPQSDSALIYYQTLVSKYPTSPYVALVQPKLMAVQVERASKAVEGKDSVKTAAPQQKVAPPPVPQQVEDTQPGAGRRARRSNPGDAPRLPPRDSDFPDGERPTE
jgi:TolA-binding protein